MATTLEQIKSYLEQSDLKYEADEENQRIITGFQTENVEDFLIAISLGEGGEYLQILAPQLLTNINDAHTPVLFKALLNLSLQTNMVRWGYDPMAREICAIVDLPLMDSVLTEKQFGLCLEALVRIVDEIAMSKYLWENNWHIFFAGHSHTESLTGKIHINQNDSLNIDELKNGLRKAIQGGLQLAIFNSCDGLGLKRVLK